jgi:hypothetical protein
VAVSSLSHSQLGAEKVFAGLEHMRWKNCHDMEGGAGSVSSAGQILGWALDDLIVAASSIKVSV